MISRARKVSFVLISVFVSLSLKGQAAEDDFSILKEDQSANEVEAPAAGESNQADSSEEVDVPVGTKLYDAESVEEMFREYKAANEKRAEQMAPHMNSEALDVIELAPVQVDPYHIRNFDMLLEKIDPQPRRRLERLAELDPKAAADLHVSMQSEQRFFAGESDLTYDDNAGRVAPVDFRKIGASVASALDRAKQAARGKKMTDDQESLPVSESSE